MIRRLVAVCALVTLPLAVITAAPLGFEASLELTAEEIGEETTFLVTPGIVYYLLDSGISVGGQWEAPFHPEATVGEVEGFLDYEMLGRAGRMNVGTVAVWNEEEYEGYLYLVLARFLGSIELEVELDGYYAAEPALGVIPAATREFEIERSTISFGIEQEVEIADTITSEGPAAILGYEIETRVAVFFAESEVRIDLDGESAFAATIGFTRGF